MTRCKIQTYTYVIITTAIEESLLFNHKKDAQTTATEHTSLLCGAKSNTT